MELLKDTLKVNKDAFFKTLENIKFLPILSIIFIVFRIVESFVLSLLSGFNFGSTLILGFARAAVSIAFMSAIISILSDIVIYNRFNFKNFFDRFGEYFTPVANTYLFIFLLEYVVNAIESQINSYILIIVIAIAIQIILSPIYEKIYIGNVSGFDAITESANFITTNIIQWLPIMVIFVYLQINFNLSYAIVEMDLKYILITFILGVVLAFTYLYKGHLFSILNGSSLRKRQFQGKF